MKQTHNFSRHYHLGVRGTPSVTCWVAEREPSESLPNNSFVSFAICSPKDNFNRKLGTEIAINRMKSGKYIQVDRWAGTRGETLLDEIIASLDKQEDTLDTHTSRVREVLRYYHNPEDSVVSMEEEQEEYYGFYYGKVLPYLSKFRIFQRIFYGI